MAPAESPAFSDSAVAGAKKLASRPLNKTGWGSVACGLYGGVRVATDDEE